MITSIINILSLTIGIIAFILIILYVHHELSYDKFNENHDRIYRLQTDNYAKFPPIIGEYIKTKIPDIQYIARIVIIGNGKELISYSYPGSMEVPVQAESYSYYADSTVFKVFTLPFLQGQPESALIEPFTVVLTKSTAKKLFGELNPMGESVEIGDHSYKVTGIIRDVRNSHIEINALKSYDSFLQINNKRNLNRIESSSFLWSATYCLMSEKTDPGIIEGKINDVLAEINNAKLFMIEFQEFHILPLRDIYFKGSTANLQYGKQGNLILVKTFLAIAVFVLALACINYINLTTARATLRSKEVALKRVVGSSRVLLRYQFILESVLVTLIAFFLASNVVLILMPQFNQLAMVNINISELNTPVVWGISVIGVLLIGVISGVYPAIYLTTINTVSLMKGESIKGSKGTVLRQALLTFQFSISIILTIGIFTIIRQLNYAKNIDLGFNKEQIIFFKTPDFPGQRKHELRRTFKERLIKYPDIQKISFTVRRMGVDLIPSPDFFIDGVERSGWVYMVIDPDYMDMMEIEIIEGRDFSWNNEGDRNFRFICNETAANQISPDSTIVGKKAYYTNPYQPDTQLQMEIIGIVEDFHFQSVHHTIEPMSFVWFGPEEDINIKISANNVPETIKNIEKEWKNIYGAKPFQYSFLDDLFDEQYRRDEQGAKIIGYFTILAIIIAGMGLFALSSFMAVRRTKEIGIRKAMGASAQNIFFLLSQEFLKWILISIIIATPIGWILMKSWLRGFAYHVNLGVNIFLMVALFAVFIALMTVTWQSLKTARGNPVDALRYE
jgi:putative ABC transport system permease protein